MADDRLQVSVNNDALAATLSILAGTTLAKGAVAAALDEAGVVHGIDQRQLVEAENRISDENFSLEETQIACATPAIHGTDGEIVLNFDPGPHAGTARPDGSLDLLDRGLLQKVASGDALGSVRPPTTGKAGITVTGEEIQAVEGKELAMQFGDGVEVGDEGAVSASRNGAIHFKPGALLDVLDHYEHKGNVDVRSGHIDTNGSVSIGGAVNANFEVRSEGDVEIRGTVIGGRVIAKGSVQVMGMVSAGEDGRICAGGDIRAKHAQIADLRSGGGVILATDCVGSVVRARTLEVGRSFLGGEAIVESSITTHVAGSPSGAGTVLRVGEPYECDRDAIATQSSTGKVRRQISRRNGSTGRGERAAEGRHSRESALLERERMKRHIERATARRELLKVAVIDVADTVNVGVQVRFGTSHLDIDTTLGPTRFKLDTASGDITMETPES